MMAGQKYVLLTGVLALSACAHALVPARAAADRAALTRRPAATLEPAAESVGALKARILQFGATLDRGQGYNPTSGDQYKDRMDAARASVADLVAAGSPPVTADGLAGDWELVFSSVPHGIFRSSPFFLAVEEAYRRAGAPEKADLFFKLHELQTCSWGASKIGRVGQRFEGATLYSEFDTQLFALTVIPVLGWFKLLPTFGGCVVTGVQETPRNPGFFDFGGLYLGRIPVDSAPSWTVDHLCTSSRDLDTKFARIDSYKVMLK